jgi:hypothetical protein
MLERSYRDCLLAADLIEPGVLAKGALAESIAPLVRIPEPRLRWTTTPLPNPAARRGGAGCLMGTESRPTVISQSNRTMASALHSSRRTLGNEGSMR